MVTVGASAYAAGTMPVPDREAAIVSPQRVAASLLVLAALVSGCTDRSTSPAERPTAASAVLRLDASVAQFRFDEGTRNLKAGVTNNGTGDIHVSRATIEWTASRSRW